jgi:uncharacterized integral membrane protein (TIGR00698 family)
MAQETGDTPARKPTFLEDALFGASISDVPAVVPGTLLSAAVFVGAYYLAGAINSLAGFKGLVSYILVAIVIGILVRNTLGLHAVFAPGVRFCLRKLLRLGIIMMGIRLSILHVVEIGGYGIPIVVACIGTGLVVATYATRALNLPERLGTLIAVGTGICGASAIVATAPCIQAKDEEVTYAVANITIFGIAAMFFYPYLGHLIFGGATTLSGLFMGTSIHETAQVAGAGLIYDQTFDVAVRPSGADVAMVTKLVRNAMMVIAIPAITYVHARRMRSRGQTSAAEGPSLLQLVPVFIIGFLVMAVLRSVGDAGLGAGHRAFGIWEVEAWKAVTQGIRTGSGYIMATAMAGVGLGTSLRAMRGLGVKPFLVGILAATSVGVVSAVLVLLLGPLVSL